MLLLSSATTAAAATAVPTAIPVAIPSVPAVRHGGVDLAEDADAVYRVVLPGLAGDGRSASMLISENAQGLF